MESRAVPRALLVGLVLTAATAVVLAFLWAGARDTEPAEITRYLSSQDEAVARTASEVLEVIINYSPETVEEQADRVREIGTGEFLEDYEALIEGGLSEVVASTAATSKGEIATGPDVAFISADRAVAVARVAQEVTTTETTTPRNVFSVMRIGLVLQDGIWRAERLEVLSQNSL